jgi:hypothetical protein
MKTSAMVAMMVTGLVFATRASAGPPYTTDDPEPVEYRHWELYLASQDFHDREGWSGTAPHVEVNYGVVPDVQLHVVAPLSYVVPDVGVAHVGYGDTELGVKLRFVHEGKWTPQIGTFPMFEAPTGSHARGLGNGSAQLFVPLWLQKSFGEWTTYGGGGAWFDLGSGRDRWWYFGWQAQRRLSEALTIGAELFHLTPRSSGTDADTRFNVGAVIDFGDTHHLLLSAGRSIVGSNLFQGYVAYQATFGPHEEGSR